MMEAHAGPGAPSNNNFTHQFLVLTVIHNPCIQTNVAYVLRGNIEDKSFIVDWI